jgi:SAM-dependent methyltransferase
VTSTGEPPPRHLVDPASNEALVERYGAVGYAAQSNALTHPDRLATVAVLHGLSAATPVNCSVLEIGCSDGANLLPMAASLPGAVFAGCDLSPQAIALARLAVSETGLGNVTLVEGDLRALPDSLGSFDFIIAHGIYSWVPAPVRDAVLALAAERLSPAGLLFASYNVYPGCHVRKAVWEALRFHSAAFAGARERLDAARALAAALAEAGRTQNENDALLRREFARVAQETDSALYHDDLGFPNDPVYFHEFADHARRHGLAFVSEARLFNSSSFGVPARMQPFVSESDRVRREQYLDFAVLRRFRQSILCRAHREASIAWSPQRARTMHAAASVSLTRAAGQQRALLNPSRSPLDAADSTALQRMLERLLEVAPRSLAVTDLEAGAARASRPVSLLLAEAFVADEVALHVHPPRITETPPQRPLASPVARWQARTGRNIVNLDHETLQIADAGARALLALFDGARDRAALDDAVGSALGADDPATRRLRIDDYVRQFARLGLLIG